VQAGPGALARERREEVAQLAGVSAGCYARLRLGSSVPADERTREALAGATT
jgi:hypothetical protein